MSPRQTRRERREADRKARKAEIKRMKAAQCDAPLGDRPDPRHRVGSVSDLSPVAEPVGFVSQSTPKLTRAEINRANAQHSTGPTSPEGKLASSRNSLRHGLASGTLIVLGEDPAEFEALQAALIEEHQPATETETLLVIEMAQSWWLMQRAIRLQNECFSEDGVDEKRLALFLRYQTTHERAFHKALAALQKLNRQQPVSDSGFVSQNHAHPTNNSGFVPQNAPTQGPKSPPALPWAA